MKHVPGVLRRTRNRMRPAAGRYIATLLVTFLLGGAVWKRVYLQRQLAFAGKPLEIGQHGRDELLPARVLSP